MANELIEKARDFYAEHSPVADVRIPKLMADFARSLTEWVPTSDRLPALGQLIWVTRRSDMRVVERMRSGLYGDDEFRSLFVAWMPRESGLPPYQPQPTGEPAQDAVKGGGKC